MLVNKAAIAVRHAAKDGKGTGPMNHVKITKTEALATDEKIACKLTLPCYSADHPLGMNGYEGPTTLLKKELDLVDRVLPSSEDDEDDPRNAAIITAEGAIIDAERLVTITFGANGGDPNLQSSLPIDNIDFPDIDAVIPAKSRKGENKIKLSVKTVAKLLKVAKGAGIETLQFQVPDEPDQAVRVTGIVGTGGQAQMLTAVLQPIVSEEEEASLF